MSPETMLHECDRALGDLLPDQSRPVQKTLAAVLCGLVRGRSIVLSRLGLHMPGRASPVSKQRQAQRLLANPHLDVARAQRRLLARVLAARGPGGRVDLLLDAVVRGASARQTGTVSLVLALAWHRRALPLVWRTWAVDAPGQNWQAAIRAVVATVQTALPPTTQVVVLVDRGLSGSELARTVLTAGPNWHFLWRVIRTTRVQHPDGTVRLIGELAPAPGDRRCLNGARVYAPRHKAQPGAGGWQSDWKQAVEANVVAVWRPHDAEPWLLVTDLPACGARCGEYRRRTWEEELFRDLKRLGWQWQQSRVLAPARVQCLLLVLALATLWMVALGQRLLRHGGPDGRRALEGGRRRRAYSHFQLGMRWCEQRLDAHRRVPCRLTLWPEQTARVKLS
jgi:hypothetical protein